MGVSLVAMTKYEETGLNVTTLDAEAMEKQFEPEGILNALMLIPPVSTLVLYNMILYQ